MAYIILKLQINYHLIDLNRNTNVLFAVYIIQITVFGLSTLILNLIQSLSGYLWHISTV